MASKKAKFFIIEDNTDNDLLFPKDHARGAIPRDYDIDPEEMFEQPSEMDLIPESDWDAQYEAQEQAKSSCMHIRMTGNHGKMIPNLDQDGIGYCWGHSITHAVMVANAAANKEYEPLSAFGLCAPIKNGRDEGGWCGLSAQRARQVGIPTQKTWPQDPSEGRKVAKYDNAESQADAARNKIVEGWVDLTKRVYDQNMTFAQVATCLFKGECGAVDFNWWSHSVCALRIVRIEKGSFGLLILNSWKGWGDNGMAVLRGQKMYPNGAVFLRTTTPSAPRSVGEFAGAQM